MFSLFSFSFIGILFLNLILKREMDFQTPSREQSDNEDEYSGFQDIDLLQTQGIVSCY